jgi:hypothetical protein
MFLTIIQCDRGTSLDLFLKGVLLDTTAIFGIVGCGCSSATESVAEIIHQWNISLVRQIQYCIGYLSLMERVVYKFVC